MKWEPVGTDRICLILEWRRCIDGWAMTDRKLEDALNYFVRLVVSAPDTHKIRISRLVAEAGRRGRHDTIRQQVLAGGAVADCAVSYSEVISHS